MLHEIRIEFLKLLRKPRTYIGPMGMIVLIALLSMAVKYGHEFEHMRDALSQEFFVAGSFVNAAFLTRYILIPPVVLMFLPLFTCMVFGDLLASEAADGTLRMILCRPVKRITVLSAKYVAGVAYSLALVLGAGIFAYLLGIALLGRGDLLNFTDGVCVFPERSAILRLLEVYMLIAAGMVAIGSIAFAVSAFLGNSNGAVGGAVGIVIVSGILGHIEYFERLRPFLLTTYLDIDRFFAVKLDAEMYRKSILVMLAYAVLSFVVGAIAFCRRDVLT
jgi:ABC-2 type transport system permease protein